MDVVIDIETIPDQAPGAVELIAAGMTVKAPDLTKPKLIDALGLGEQGKYKSVAELKDMWIEEFGEGAKIKQAKDKWLKTSFDGGYGEICCVSVKSDRTNTMSFYGENYPIIKNMWEYVGMLCENRPPFFIAHNAKFDLPFLYHRSVINGIKPAKGFKPHGRHGQEYFCTMEAWAGFNGKIGLDRLAKILGIEGKEGMNGADVWPEYQKGNISGIADYCQDDVRITSEIYKRLKFN